MFHVEEIIGLCLIPKPPPEKFILSSHKWEILLQ